MHKSKLSLYEIRSNLQYQTTNAWYQTFTKQIIMIAMKLCNEPSSIQALIRPYQCPLPKSKPKPQIQIAKCNLEWDLNSSDQGSGKGSETNISIRGLFFMDKYRGRRQQYKTLTLDTRRFQFQRERDGHFKNPNPRSEKISVTMV